MAQMANITVYDGAATPVAHTFVPVSVTREKAKTVAEWRENSLTVPVYASPRLTLTMENLKSGVTKVEQRVVIPVMEAIGAQNASGYTAAPKVAYENTLYIGGFFHPRSDLVGRRILRQMIVNLGGSVFTSVPTTNTGYTPEMIDLLIMPT